jgi:dCTP deaminase
MKKVGALPSQVIREMTQNGAILKALEENIRPASLDLSISEEIFRVEGIFLPRLNEKIRDLLGKIIFSPHDLKYPLEVGAVYLARLNEEFRLPEEIYGYCNPKSTTGRTDIHVRVLADGSSRYDALPSGFKGNLWMVIQPKSFPIKIFPNTTLSQLRLFNTDTRFNEPQLQIAMERDKLLWSASGDHLFNYNEVGIKDNDGSIILTLDLTNEIAGYECRGLNKVLDFSKVKFYSPEDFFEPIKKNNEIYLKKDSFYIFSTKEALRVPPYLACEMVPMDERSGEFRSHYAGFFDPGWGWGANGEGKGRTATLEIRPFENLMVRDGQPITKMRFEQMTEIPDILYENINSYYKAQKGPRLSRHFKSAN